MENPKIKLYNQSDHGYLQNVLYKRNIWRTLHLANEGKNRIGKKIKLAINPLIKYKRLYSYFVRLCLQWRAYCMKLTAAFGVSTCTKRVPRHLDTTGR